MAERDAMKLHGLVLMCWMLTLIFPRPSFAQTMPQDAHKTPDGEWECNSGYRQVGKMCQRVEKIPPNAREDIFGDGWTCNRGYKRVGSGCLPMTEKERRRQNEQDKARVDQLKQSQGRSMVSGNSCDTDSTSGANVCVTVQGTNFDCSESFGNGDHDTCHVEITVSVETDYRDEKYIDGTVQCEATVATTDARGHESMISNDENTSVSLYGNESTYRSIDIAFSFLRSEEIRKVQISDLSCRIKGPDTTLLRPRRCRNCQGLSQSQAP